MNVGVREEESRELGASPAGEEDRHLHKQRRRSKGARKHDRGARRSLPEAGGQGSLTPDPDSEPTGEHSADREPQSGYQRCAGHMGNSENGKDVPCPSLARAAMLTPLWTGAEAGDGEALGPGCAWREEELCALCLCCSTVGPGLGLPGERARFPG